MNSPRFIRFTPAHQPGDVFVRADAVTHVGVADYLRTASSPAPDGKVTSIGTTGGGYSYVKESPSQVIEALRAAENTHYVTVEYVIDDGDTSSLADDCECNCGMTCSDDEPDAADYALALKEALADAKIADERAEWYRKVAENASAQLSPTVNENVRLDRENVALKQQLAAAKDATASAIADRDGAMREAAFYRKIADARLDLIEQKQRELNHYAEEVGTEVAKNANLRNERDRLLAKLKDTTAALEKANCELNAARYGRFWYGSNGNSAGFPKPD